VWPRLVGSVAKVSRQCGQGGWAVWPRSVGSVAKVGGQCGQGQWAAVIIFGLRFAFFMHISGKTRTVSKYVREKRNDFRQLKMHKQMLIKTCTNDIEYNEVISE